MSDWTDDLAAVISHARIDETPRPLCIAFTWTDDGRCTATVTALGDHEAARWEHSARATLDARCVGHGRMGATTVRVTTAADLYEQHVSSALRQTIGAES